MASSLSNASTIPQDRDKQVTSFDQGTAIKAPLHFGTGFGSAKNGWKNSIWASSRSANAFTDAVGDSVLSADQHCLSSEADQVFRGTVGSGSLLPAPETDGWSGRAGLPWSKSVTSSPPALSRNGSHDVSPIRYWKSGQTATMSDLNGSSLPLPPQSRPSFGQMADQGPYSTQRDPTSNLALKGSLVPSLSGANDLALSESQSTPVSSTVNLGNTVFVPSVPSTHYLGDFSRNDSPCDIAISQPRNFPRAKLDEQRGSQARPLDVTAKPDAPLNAAPRLLYRSIYPSPDDLCQDRQNHVMDKRGFQAPELDRLNLHGTVDQYSQNLRRNNLPPLSFPMPHESLTGRFNRQPLSNDLSSSDIVSSSAEVLPEYAFECSPVYYRSTSIDNCGPSSPSPNQSRRVPSSPFYSATNTGPFATSNQSRSNSISYLPSRVSTRQVTLLDTKPRDLQPYQADQHFLQPNPLQLGSPCQQSGGMAYQAQMQMNPLAPPYAMPAYPTYSNVQAPQSLNSRYRKAEHEPLQVYRSPLLEDFRTNSKTNRRCELRDIYNHIVEFSGDQYGSRFIQQKLETANSDEKDRVFGEIQPNAIQLMTDVFGNYVIQKFFEHGNQTQKKILANQMKGRVFALSMQPYGCRVVQKALEYVLVDQQASIVKELESNVHKCVNDQNGNHVIQKAVERVPGHHVQFIIKAFNEQIQRLATHAYGCRVIQRMLEYCENAARRSILDELHSCASTLIFDQFGNYVIQHVIENGEEQDRSRMINVIVSRVFQCSKHKFASNVVEKAIEFGELGQKTEILRVLTTANEHGGNPALALVCDGYGNYVIQKVLGYLRGTERESLVEQIRAHLMHLKRVNNNSKQVTAIERLIYSTDTDSNPNVSSQSSSLPSTNASTVEGPTGNLHQPKNDEPERASTPTPVKGLQIESG